MKAKVPSPSLLPIIRRMREKRLSEGYSIRELAQVIGISFSSIARLERGEGQPDPYSADRIWRWVENDESSAPKVRMPGEESWFAKIERRISHIEECLRMLEEMKP